MLFGETSWTPRGRDESRPPPPKQEPEVTRILVSEPHLLYRRILSVLLASPRIALTQVEHGEAAIDLLSIRWFDMIILDFDSPRMGFQETTRWIRYSAAPWSDIPILGLLGEIEQEQAGRLMSAGMTDWTPKPLQREHLRERVVGLLPALHNAGL